MRGLAKWKFKELLGFAFQNPPTNYSAKDFPDAISMKDVFSVDQLCNIDAKSDIDKFFDGVLLR